MVEKLLGDVMADIEAAPEATDAQLATISKMVKLLAKLDDDVATATEVLSRATAARVKVAEVDLPEALTTAGFSPPTKMKIAGMDLKFETNYHASIPKAKQEAAFAWLEENGHGDMIKHEVKIKFGKEEDSFFKKFVRDLMKRKKPVKAEIKDSVAPQTLGAFVREQISEGASIPMDLLGVFTRRSVSVTPITGSGK